MSNNARHVEVIVTHAQQVINLGDVRNLVESTQHLGGDCPVQLKKVSFQVSEFDKYFLEVYENLST